MSATNDSADLEALFDSIASDYQPAAPVVEAPPAPPANTTQLGDSDELQALFDSVSAQSEPVDASPAGEPTDGSQERVFNRIGHMARTLHDALKELGYDKLLNEAMSALPDAQDRLAYVANLTEQAACRVLNATDIATPVVESIENSAKSLGQRWDQVFANQMNAQDFKLLANETRDFLKHQLPGQAQVTHAQLTEIMMAQDFQDLTGQVIKKIVALAQTLESGLMSVLIEVMPDAKRTKEVDSLMNGPVINAEGRTDVVVNQQQVDDLLDSLGF